MNTRSMDELFGAANHLIDTLIGMDAALAEIEAALKAVCPDWEDADLEAALILAARLADRISAELFEGDADFTWMMCHGIHLGFLSHRINVHLGRERELGAEDQRQITIDRLLAYPLRYRGPP